MEDILKNTCVNLKKKYYSAHIFKKQLSYCLIEDKEQLKNVFK